MRRLFQSKPHSRAMALIYITNSSALEIWYDQIKPSSSDGPLQPFSMKMRIFVELGKCLKSQILPPQRLELRFSFNRPEVLAII